mgnify:CR=1 FL=1
MLNEGVDFTIIDHFIGAGALWAFLLALGMYSTYMNLALKLYITK